MSATKRVKILASIQIASDTEDGLNPPRDWLGFITKLGFKPSKNHASRTPGITFAYLGPKVAKREILKKLKAENFDSDGTGNFDNVQRKEWFQVSEYQGQLYLAFFRRHEF